MNVSQTNVAAARMPRHVAIIMDGNGRWAKERKLPRKAGHQQGVEAVRELVTNLEGKGIQYLTLYGFSAENWSRPPSEVSDLMGLLRLYIRKDLDRLHKNNVCIRVIGERRGLSADLVKLIDDAEGKTHLNTGMNLIIAFNYGGRDEITAAAIKLAKSAVEGSLDPESITQETVSNALYTKNIPDPDLIIRTSGEQRLSNFLTWQSAYSEFVFVDVYWPEFTIRHLEEAVAEYNQRDRRFGGRPGEDVPEGDDLLRPSVKQAT